MRMISSASASVRPLRAVNAVRNAGSEPLNALSTNRSLFAA